MADKSSRRLLYEQVLEEAQQGIKARKEIGKLEHFISQEITGKPSGDESAVDTAIRLLRGCGAAAQQQSHWPVRTTVTGLSPQKGNNVKGGNVI